MKHILELNAEAKEFLESIIFPHIYKSETILFLGAGASVTNKRFLGNDIIDYYQDKLGINLETKDLVEFVDILSSYPKFDRNDFDNFILELITKVEVGEVHKNIANIQWREIITTNYDLLIEKAFDELLSKSTKAYKLKPVRCKEEYSGYNIPTEIKYVKLNGCASDKSKYPFVASTKDFKDSFKYYRTIFNSLENLSPNIQFLSIGFSFSDGLSNFLINKFDSYNFRNKKWIFSIDPFVNQDKLPFYSESKICIIKLFPDDFFKLYNEWVENKAKTLIKRKSINYTNANNQHLILSAKLTLSLGESLVQLTDTNSLQTIVQKEFYKGNKPTYDVIRKNYDVTFNDDVRKVVSEINRIFTLNKEKIVPILFLQGHYGNGKSTFVYRAIHTYLHESENSLAFEIIEPEKLNESDLIELFTISKGKNILLLCNELEIDSQFKVLMNLRTKLSLEQFSEFNLVIISSIRENILTKYLKSSSYKNFHVLSTNLKFNRVEAVDFVYKLNSVGLVNYQDIPQRDGLVSKVLIDYHGEPYISLLGLTKNQENHLDIILEDAYRQLTEKGKEAVLYTSIVYQFKILMPGNILMKLISKDWDAFTKEIMNDDCKGILIQDIIPNNGTEPDLYFRTKHSLLSERLVNNIINSEDKLFEKIKRLFSFVHETDYNSKFVINFLKALKDTSSINQEKINKLFDILAKEFNTNQHFNLHYAINLQNERRTSADLKLAIDRLVFASSKFAKRSHLIIHRRASINFDLAKIYFKIDKQNEYEHYIREAQELFKIKLIEDPCSSYSYVDYLSFEIWCLQNLSYDEADYLRQHILIQDLFDAAEQTVFENSHKISEIKAKYLSLYKDKAVRGKKSLLQYLDELYENEDMRPYSLALKYNFLIESEKNDEAEQLIEEMLYYKHIEDVAKILFKYYGRNLYITQNILNYFEIVNNNPSLKTKEKLRFHFFSYVAESYNRAFHNTHEHLNEIKFGFNNLNPEVSKYWLDTDGNVREFDSLIIKNNKDRFQAKIIDFQQKFYFKKSEKELKLNENSKCKVNLIFTLKGIRAEIIS